MHTCARLFVVHLNVFICVLNFCGWSQLQKYYNSQIFQIYGMFEGIKTLNVCRAPCCGKYQFPTRELSLLKKVVRTKKE